MECTVNELCWDDWTALGRGNRCCRAAGTVDGARRVQSLSTRATSAACYWRWLSFAGALAFVREAIALGLQSTQIAGRSLVRFRCAPRRAQRPTMPPTDAFGRLPLSWSLRRDVRNGSADRHSAPLCRAPWRTNS
jgi:hypothetical protein